MMSNMIHERQLHEQSSSSSFIFILDETETWLVCQLVYLQATMPWLCVR